jgi:hypothetical protein
MLDEYASRFGPRSLPKRADPFFHLMGHNHSTGGCKSRSICHDLMRQHSRALINAKNRRTWAGLSGKLKHWLLSNCASMAGRKTTRTSTTCCQASSLLRKQHATRMGRTFARFCENWLPGSLGSREAQRLCSASVPYQLGPLVVLVHGQLLLQVRRS